MHMSICNVAGAAFIYFVGVLTAASGHCTEKLEIKEWSSEEIEPCNNFYKHVCHRRDKNIIGTSPSALKKQLHAKLKGILKDDPDDHGSLGVESDIMYADMTILSMARKLYNACVKDQHKASKKDVKSAMTKMLQSIGIKEWPLTKKSQGPTKTKTEILEQTGLRPFATIAPVPDRKNPWYIVSVNGPFPRFGASPERMKNIKSETTSYSAYRTFLQSVVKLFLEEENGSPTTPEPSVAQSTLHDGNEGDSEEYEYGGDEEYEYEEEEEKEKEEGKGQDEEEETDEAAPDVANNEASDDDVGNVITDIINVEVKLANMMVTARIFDYYQTDKVGNWQKRLGRQLAFMNGLRTDFGKAHRTLADDDIIGVHLTDYFVKLSRYLETLDVKTLVNYLGWYFVREVADVLTMEIRKTLNAFLKAISKPGVAKTLHPESCIDKLIGYDAKMEKGIAHLYLNRFFREESISKAQRAAEYLNVSFGNIIARNTWMDEYTRTNMSKWNGELEYHMGASRSLLDEKYIMSQYDLVQRPEEDSLPLLFVAYMENNFLQQISLYNETYDRRKTWSTSSLATEGRYSPHYTSLDMPAGALQDSIFRYEAAYSSIFGSMGTLTAEKLTHGFVQEGKGWRFRKGEYLWTSSAQSTFKKRLQCLRKRHGKHTSGEKTRKMNAQEKFENKGDEATLPMKLRDHFGLRTSFEAFKLIVSECKNDNKLLKDEDGGKMSKNFFYSYAQRHCESGDSDAEYRVNFALRTYEEFWHTFQCQNGTRMRTEDTCRIVTGADNAVTPLVP